MTIRTDVMSNALDELAEWVDDPNRNRDGMLAIVEKLNEDEYLYLVMFIENDLTRRGIQFTPMDGMVKH